MRSLLALLAVAGATTLSVGAAVSSAEDYGSDLSAAREFDAFDLYYADETFEGQSITHVLSRRDWGHTSWAFVYGDCEPPSGGSCAGPLEIQDWSLCVRHPRAYQERIETFRFRGARAGWVPSAQSFEVYTGKTAVVIFADDRAMGRRAARALFEIHETAAQGKLPPPKRGAMAGRLRCQR